MNLLELTREQLETLLREWEQPAYRAAQVWDWLYQGAAFEEMTNLPKTLRQRLAAECVTGLPGMAAEQQAADGTKKVLWSYADGSMVESVLMRYKHGDSACLSTQVGCRMGCAFCASCAGGLTRNLTHGEIMGQYLGLRRLLGKTISHVVLMGMGEPLDNLDAVLMFLRRLNEEVGVSLRHLSVSTCGLIPGMQALQREALPVTLSVSLHAPDNETRSKLMPINRTYPIERLMKACDAYFEATGRRISYEYSLIDGVNDSDGHADRLIRLLRGRPAHINLIACNPVEGKPYTASRRARQFQARLIQGGLNATIRRSLGQGIDAACGQLRQRETPTGEVKA